MDWKPGAFSLALILVCAVAGKVGAATESLLGADAILQKLENVKQSDHASADDPVFGFVADPPALSAEQQAALAETDKLIKHAQPNTGKPAPRAAAWLTAFSSVERLAAIDNDQDRAFGSRPYVIARKRRVLDALPAPETWPALADALRQRYAVADSSPISDTQAAALALAAVLSDDTAAMQQLADTVAKQEVQGGNPDRRADNLQSMRNWIVRRQGKAARVALFVDKVGNTESSETTAVPDLVALMGEQAADPVLLKILSTDRPIAHIAGAATLARLRSLAQSNMALLPRPQWKLVAGPDCAALFEAMLRRFPQSDSDAPGQTALRWLFSLLLGRDAAVSAPSGESGEPYAQARREYVGALIASGRTSEAVSLYRRIRDEINTYPLDKVLDRVDEAGHAARLLAFLRLDLQDDNFDSVWKKYAVLAPRLGQQDEMLAQLRSAVRYASPGSATSRSLNALLIDSLLAADRVDEGVAAILARFADKQVPILDRLESAGKLCVLGRLLNNPEWNARGIRELGLGLGALPADFASHTPEAVRAVWMRPTLVDVLLDEYARQARHVEREALLLSELSMYTSPSVSVMNRESSRIQRLLVELVATYGAAGRPTDVLTLLRDSALWNERDLAQLSDATDQHDNPLGLYVARALIDTGQRAQARSVLESVMIAHPGYDPAYALYVELRGLAALGFLEQQIRLDPLEERPLLWKAILLKGVGRVQEATELARRAQAIDPSDGDERSPDRMRVYAVLAELLPLSGDLQTAAVYTNAVAAIRLGEQADELRSAGLHARAVENYRRALALFSDAYCVQSRLAVELNEQGRYAEAEAHYRRAYELMPQSFGRLESHCFGCEHIFRGDGPKSIAERVFTQLLRKTPEKPQVHYVMGYLRREQGRYAEAVQHQRDAVAHDGDYLSAWKQLYLLDDEYALEPGERDLVSLRLLSLDPTQRHVHVDIGKIGDAHGLYLTMQAAHARLNPVIDKVFALPASAAALDASEPGLSAWMRQLQQDSELFAIDRGAPPPGRAVAESAAMTPVRDWLGLSGGY